MKRIVPPNIEQMLNAMREVCGRAEMCSYEIGMRLRRRGCDDVMISQVLDKLVDERYVDDARFARSFVNDRVRFAHWGVNKIRLALMAKRISSSLISDALAHMPVREYARGAFASMHKKLLSLPEDMPIQEKRQRLYRYGLQRGYEPSLIYRILDSKSLWNGA